MFIKYSMNIVFLFERKVKILGKIKEILYRSIYDMEVNYKQAQEILRQTNGALLDVRSHQEYDEEHLPNAINIDLYNLQNEIQIRIPNKRTTIIVYCSCGIRSKQAQQILWQLGYSNVYNLKEGIYCRFRNFTDK